MDAQRFDALIRRLFATSTDRRGGLRFVPVGVAVTLGFSVAEADAKKGGKKKRKKKKKNGQQQDPPTDPNNQNSANVQNECLGDADCDKRYAPGLNCVSGQCACKAGGNCTGCCENSKKCILKENQNYTACGLGGNACESCNPNVGCNRDKGYCECTPQTCFGCCAENNKRCLPGRDVKFCGQSSFCEDCTKHGVGLLCPHGSCCLPVGAACGDGPFEQCCSLPGPRVLCHHNNDGSKVCESHP